MKSIFVLAAFAVSLAMPAKAQENWAGAPVSASIYKPGAACYVVNNGSPGYYAAPCSPANIALGGSVVPTGFEFNNGDGSPTGVYTGTINTIPVEALDHMGVVFQLQYADPTSPIGTTYFTGVVPLSAFARADHVSSGGSQQELQALNTRIDGVQGSVNTLSERIDAYAAQQRALASQAARQQQLAIRGVAMASSLYILAPADGASNRIAFGVGSYGNETAVSVNYTKRAGMFDLAVSAAVSNGDGLGKAGVGFSW